MGSSPHRGVQGHCRSSARSLARLPLADKPGQSLWPPEEAASFVLQAEEAPILCSESVRSQDKPREKTVVAF